MNVGGRRRLLSWPLALVLATLVHVDWHFARPLEYRLSLEWSTHWLFGAGFFAVAGWFIGRRWSEEPWAAAVWNVGVALIMAQVLLPVFEEGFYRGRFGYDVEPARWTAFWECLGAGLPAMILAVWSVTRVAAQRRTSPK